MPDCLRSYSGETRFETRFQTDIETYLRVAAESGAMHFGNTSAVTRKRVSGILGNISPDYKLTEHDVVCPIGYVEMSR